MSEGGLHVVFGTGQVGLALADRLAGLGLEVRAVSRHLPVAVADGVDGRAADATDLDAAADAAKGASVVYQCLNAPYTRWPDLFPPLQRGVLDFFGAGITESTLGARVFGNARLSPQAP